MLLLILFTHFVSASEIFHQKIPLNRDPLENNFSVIEKNIENYPGEIKKRGLEENFNDFYQESQLVCFEKYEDEQYEVCNQILDLYIEIAQRVTGEEYSSGSLLELFKDVVPNEDLSALKVLEDPKILSETIEKNDPNGEEVKKVELGENQNGQDYFKDEPRVPSPKVMPEIKMEDEEDEEITFNSASCYFADEKNQIFSKETSEIFKSRFQSLLQYLKNTNNSIDQRIETFCLLADVVNNNSEFENPIFYQVYLHMPDTVFECSAN